MKTKIKILSLTVICVFMFLAVGIAFAQTMNKSTSKSAQLLELESKKQEYLQKNEKVPFDIEKEIYHLKGLAKAEENLQEEVAKIEKKRAEAPKDEEGNLILPNNASKFEKTLPNEEVGEIGKAEYAYTFFPTQMEREKYDLTSIIKAPYDIIIAGSYSSNKDNGVLYHIKTSPDSSETVREELKFDGKGKIVIESLEADNNFVTFRYGNEEKGYFDLKNNKAVFEKYQAK